MIELTPPSRDQSLDYVTVSESESDTSYKEALRNTQGRIATAYGVYEAAMSGAGSCPPLTNLSPAAVDALKRSYGALRTRVALQPMREELLALADEIDGHCPYCGVDQATTLDHYAPQERFPEFAIMALNLLPCCGRCNQLKGAASAEAVERQTFSHPYFHPLEQGRVLECLVRHREGTIFVTFRLIRPANYAADLFLKVENQVRRLDILRRIERAANGELVVHASLCDGIFRFSGQAGVSRQSQRLAQRISSQWGVNHWRAALHHALASDDLFCGGGFRLLQ